MTDAPAMPRRRYVQSIAGLRAIAVLSIVAFHIDRNWLPGGFVGVDIFFVISGFVVAHSVTGQQGHERFGSYFAWFYKRRFQRILPASFLFIAVATVASVLFVPLAEQTRFIEPTGAAALFGLSNVVLFLKAGDYFALSSEYNLFTHTWSLAVEEQYYLLFPFFSYAVLVGGDRRPGARRVMLALVCGAVVSSFILSAVLTTRAPVFAFYMLPTRFWELGAGFLLRVWLTDERVARIEARGDVFLSVGAVLALVILALTLWHTDPRAFPFPGAILPCLAALLLIGVLWCGPGLWADRLLSMRPFVWFGDVSYSLYLWHWGVIVFMRWTVGLHTLPLQLFAFALMLILAWASYEGVEKRFHNQRRRAEPPSSAIFARYGAVAAGLLLFCAGGYLLKPAIGLAQADRADIWEPGSRPPIPSTCSTNKQVDALGPGIEVTFPGSCVRPGTARLIVMGDSHAGAYQRTLWRIAASGAFEPHLLTLGGCRVVYVTQVPDIARCPEFQRVAFARVRALARPGDVLFLPGLQTPRYARVEAGGPITPPRPIDSGKILESRDHLRDYAALGIPVIVEAPKPTMPMEVYRCGDWFNRGNPDCAIPPGGTAAERWRRMAPTREAMRRVVAGMPGVTLWDPTLWLCRNEECPAYLQGRPLYFDMDHLSGYANDRLTGPLLAAVRSALAHRKSAVTAHRADPAGQISCCAATRRLSQSPTAMEPQASAKGR